MRENMTDKSGNKATGRSRNWPIGGRRIFFNTNRSTRVILLVVCAFHVSHSDVEEIVGCIFIGKQRSKWFIFDQLTPSRRRFHVFFIKIKIFKRFSRYYISGPVNPGFTLKVRASYIQC